MSTPPENRAALRDAALGHLARREHSRQELVRKLAVRFPGTSPAELAAVVEQLAEDNYQSDARFAESFVRFRAHKGFGPVRLKGELRERGVAAELALSAIDSFEAANNEWGVHCARVRAAKFGAGVPSTRALEAKQIRYLLYRGFTQEQARQALAPDISQSEFSGGA